MDVISSESELGDNHLPSMSPDNDSSDRNIFSHNEKFGRQLIDRSSRRRDIIDDDDRRLFR